MVLLSQLFRFLTPPPVLWLPYVCYPQSLGVRMGGGERCSYMLKYIQKQIDKIELFCLTTFNPPHPPITDPCSFSCPCSCLGHLSSDTLYAFITLYLQDMCTCLHVCILVSLHEGFVMFDIAATMHVMLRMFTTCHVLIGSALSM